MNILFVQQQPCIRALKYAKGLRAYMPDIKISFAYIGKTLTEIYGHGDELFEIWYPIENETEKKLLTICKEARVDIIHCHNAPDTLTNICIKLFKNKIPIIHDIHDLMSARDTLYEDGVETTDINRDVMEEERIAVEQSDGVITVASEIFNQVRDHGFKLVENHLIYHNYIPASFIPDSIPKLEINLNKKLRIVYQGFISSETNSHYYFIDIFKGLARQGFEVHIYPSRDNVDYKTLAMEINGIVYHDHLKPEDLYKKLGKYDFGWTGFNAAVNLKHLDTVMPNKLFEYIACGLPVLALPHKSLKQFVEESKVGVVVKDLSKCMDLVHNTNWSNVLFHVNENKHAYSVEANIHKVFEVYRLAIENVGLSIQSVL